MDTRADSEDTDYISIFASLVNQRRLSYHFEVLREARSADELWEIGLFVGKELIAKGESGKKRRAEHAAAKNGVGWMKERDVRFRRERGHAATAKGSDNEKKVVEAFLNPSKPLPEWFVSVRRASAEEDARGIDVVIGTSDFGNLFLQVKSSHGGEIRFLGKGRRSSLIGVLVVMKYYEKPEILENALRILESMRSEIDGLRSGQTRSF